jgi:DNA-binding CsgD family transcriptional regulator/tetratricopeptide (TPR) repeat protein
LIFFSCRQDKSYFPNTGDQALLFVAQQADSIWSDIDPADRWDFLIEAAGRNYDNPSVAEDWLSTRIGQLFEEQKEQAPVESVYQLMKVLEDCFLTSASYNMGQRILSYPDAEFHQPTLALAAQAVAARYNFLKEKDSLSKYIDIMEQGIVYDTSAGLRSSLNTFKAIVAEMNGKLFEAAVFYHKAIDESQLSDSVGLSKLYLSLAVLYMDLEYKEKALLYSQKAADHIGLERFTPNMLNTYGVISGKNDELDKAEAAYRLALDYAEANNEQGLKAQYYANYGNLRRKQKKFDEALYYMSRSDSICTELGIQVGWLINHINRAELYFDQGNFAAAETEMKKAAPLAEKFKHPKISKEYYKTRYKILDALGDEVAANRNHRLYIEFKDAFTGDLPRSVIAEWELATESEKRMAESAAMELSIQSLKKDRYLAGLLFLLTLMGVSFLFFLKYRKGLLEREKMKQEQQKLAFDLELKSKELLSDSIKNITVQNTKEQIYQELTGIVQDLPAMHKAKFLSLSQKLRTDNGHPFLTEFEQRFNGVHESFYDKLRAAAPDLTPNELRICAMIRLNLSTKEIADLTGRSVGTIDNTRSSIRKKLNLSDQDGLMQFLMNL